MTAMRHQATVAVGRKAPPSLTALLLAVALLLTGGPAPAAPQAPPSPAPYVPQVQQIEVPPPVQLPGPTLKVPAAALEPLTADEAARIGLANHPDVGIASAALRAAEGRTQQARAGLNPHLRLSGTYTDNYLTEIHLQGGGGPAAYNPMFQGGDSTGAAVTASQLLCDFGYTRSLVRQAEFLETAAGANLTRVQADLVLAVKAAFYGYVQGSRMVEVAEKNLANQRQHLQQAQGRFRLGIGLPAEVTRSETAVSQAIFNLTQARNDAGNAQVNLALLMGIDPRTPLQAAEGDEPAPLGDSGEVFFNQALDNRPELAAGQAAVMAGQAALDAAHSVNSPAVTAALGYSRAGQPSYSTEQVNLTMGVSFDALDGGQRAGRLKEARADLDSYQAQLKLTQQRIVAEVARAWLTLQTARQRLAAAEAEEANASETLRLATGRYQAGLGILLDVLDAQQALVTAETNRVNARTALNLARATLNHAIGQPLAGGLPR